MRSPLAAVVPAVDDAPDDPGRNGLPGETLLMVSVSSNRDGAITLRTIWATTPDRRGGHRLTRVEDIANLATLRRRLAELAPLIWPPPAMLALPPAEAAAG